MKTNYKIPGLPTLQFVSYITTEKPVLKTDYIDIDLKDDSKYYGQADTAKTTAVGFGYYQPKTENDIINTYLGQWVAGVPSGWGLFIQ